ncbi:concanavalin A-like lectin/glucanase domain-containing protein [Lophiotrema nucula]|uniref:chitinase n=1 Tax=Lophiotrema nucula TaxID=690887 RepID=A0A6A5YKT7_9PLEO|nr:concanavalin A-like lectin/glucanase domain-containing protein [Lophiotrema nucula]
MRFSTSALFSAYAALAAAQTFTECNPTNKTCPNNPAMPKNFETDFKQGAAAVKGWKQTAGTLGYEADGAKFTINKQGEAPTIQSEGYVFFGYIEAKVKSAAGQGIISSIVLQSEDLDEVDWEFIGGVNTKVQMNYFGKGNTTTYDRMIEGAVTGNSQTETHTYALNWTSSALTWIIDGTPVRTLNYADAVGGKNFPQTPVTVRIGVWAGGDPTNEPGVIEWAGGKTDYTKAPFSMTLDSVKVINYNPGTEYKWTDQTGSFESIEVVGKGDDNGAPVNSQILTPSATASASNGGLGSGINVPTNSGGEFHEQPTATGGASHTTPCSEGETMPSTTAAPVASSAAPVPSSAAVPVNGTAPCSCGIATVTVTEGAPPPAQTPIISSAQPVASSSAAIVPPPVVSSAPPASQAPPYPTSGLITDTLPAPSVPLPTGTGVPTTTTALPSQFTGAAAPAKTAGAVLGFVAGVAMFAL